MAWFRLDDRGAFHAKVLAVGNEAYGAWCRAGQWSSGEGTEGRIPAAVAYTIAPPRVWKRLVENVPDGHDVGLATQTATGYEIHDFLDWNPTVEQVEAKRAARSEAGRRGGLRSAEARRPANVQAAGQPIGAAPAQAIASAIVNQNSTPIPIPIPIPEIEIESVSAPKSEPSRTRAKRGQNGTRLAPDWTPSPGLLAWAKAKGIGERDAAGIAERFRDHWLASTLPSARKADWDAAFRTWANRDIEAGKVVAVPPPPPVARLPPSTPEQLERRRATQATIAEALAAMDANRETAVGT